MSSIFGGAPRSWGDVKSRMDAVPRSLPEAFSQARDQNDALRVELQKRKAARPAGPRLGSIMQDNPDAGMMGSGGKTLGG